MEQPNDETKDAERVGDDRFSDGRGGPGTADGTVARDERRPGQERDVLLGAELQLLQRRRRDRPDRREVLAGGRQDGFWVDTGTVGWSFGRQPGVLITFDLGKLCAIDTIGFDTASGAAQVTFPAALMVYVSDDGKSWRYVTDVINEAVPQDRFIRHRFVAKDLNTRGQYVGVYVVKGGFYAFVDEIEVMAGDADPASITLKGEAVETDKIEADALDRAKAAVQKNISLYFIKAARDQKPDDATLAALDKLQAEAVATTGSIRSITRGPALQRGRSQGLSGDGRVLQGPSGIAHDALAGRAYDVVARRPAPSPGPPKPAT